MDEAHLVKTEEKVGENLGDITSVISITNVIGVISPILTLFVSLSPLIGLCSRFLPQAFVPLFTPFLCWSCFACLHWFHSLHFLSLVFFYIFLFTGFATVHLASFSASSMHVWHVFLHHHECLVWHLLPLLFARG